jgi:hypothetical protein
MRRVMLVAALAMVGAACAGDEDATTDDTITGDSAAAQAMADDPDMSPEGASGVPSGFAGRVDRASQLLSDVRYTELSSGKWEVVTGPHHIAYQPGDTASGAYTVTATLEQMESPAHPESFGVFIGGQDLEGPGQRYGYFMVRGTGDYLIKTREGEGTSNVVGWTASPAVPKADATGKASYQLTVQVGQDSVRFSVNGTPVTSLARGAIPADGVAGVRVGHNLHLTTTRVAIERN